MAIAKTGLAAAAILVAIAAPAAAGQAQHAGHPQHQAEPSDRAADQAILAALLQRRADVVRAPGTAESKQAALNFLDREIALLRTRLAH